MREATIKCPACKNEIDKCAKECECGWTRSKGGRKVCMRDGERDLQTYASRSMGFRVAWAERHGLYDNGDMPEWVDE